MECIGLEASTKYLTRSNIIEDTARNLSIIVKDWTLEDAMNRLQPSIDEADLRINLEMCGLRYD